MAALAYQEPRKKTAAAEAPKDAVVDAAVEPIQPAGNAAEQEAVARPASPGPEGVTGPMGRVWNRILGRPDSATDTAGMTVNLPQIRAYLTRIGLADGEWFREKKLDGVSEGLLAQYDVNKDGRLTWPEFQAFQAQLTAIIAGGTDLDQAGAQHGRTDTSRDGQASLAEVQATTKAQLPKDTAHADLVAQLGARVTLDALDTDQGNKPVAQRTLSAGEWAAGAEELKKK